MVRDSGGGPGGDGQSSRGPEDGVPPEDAAASSQTSRPSEADAPERTDGSQAAATAPGTAPSDRKPDETDPDETGPDETGPVEFDEAFIRAASVTEPAARTRALAARWQQEGYPEREPWRSDEPPAGWFWSRARQGDNGRKRRRRLRRRPWRRKPED